MSASLKRALGALVALAALAALVFWAMRPPGPGPATSSPQAPATPTGPQRFPTGKGEVTAGQTSSASAPSPDSSGGSPCGMRCYCAGATDPCAAGRTCTPGGCDGALERKAWRLRLGGVKAGGGVELDGETRVCARLPGKRESACASLKEVRSDKCPAGARLPITTEQLLGEGVDIDLVGPQGQLLATARGASYKFLTDRELCLGVRFGGSKFSGPTKVEQLWFYLDDA